MIKSLVASARFPENGVVLQGQFQPKTGLTAVVGENGSGKTFLTIEAVRWLLYGKKALRGMASDYKDAQVEGLLTIKGRDYQIRRGPKDSVTDAETDEVLAVGPEKTTEHIVELMGYGLDVFDICNAGLQGEAHRLGNMRPAERKALIDRVLRLLNVEQAEKACREEALGLRREAAALTKTLPQLEDAPVAPADYRSATELFEALSALETQLATREALKKSIKPLPVFPEKVDFSEDDYQQALVFEQRLQSFNKLTATAELSSYTAEELDQAEADNQRGPKPTLSLEQVTEHLQLWDTHLPQVTVTCPECSATFEIGGDPSPHSRKFLSEQELRHEKWGSLWGTPSTSLSADQIRTGRAAIAATEQLKDFADFDPEQSRDLQALRAARQAAIDYAALQAEEEWIQTHNAVVQRQIEALGPPAAPEAVSALREAYRQAAAYESACDRHAEAQQKFEALSAEIADKVSRAEAFEKGGKDLNAARADIKAFLAPRLSVVASQLITEMSLGKLTEVVLDEDMNIAVDGQPVQTLSGAGKTVANLALRIALGRVLTAHSFPVFLADEIDGDLSPTRRQATLEALSSLSQHLQQIILVTHRDVGVADHVWNLDLTV